MEVKLKVTSLKRSELPSPVNGRAGRLSDQFKEIIEEFMASDSEAISLLSGDPVDQRTVHNLCGQVRTCVKRNGYAGVKVVERTVANNVYVVKEA